MHLGLLSHVGIQTLQVLDVRLFPFWFKYSRGWRVWQESPSPPDRGFSKL
jgi:hypothetical protein